MNEQKPSYPHNGPETRKTFPYAEKLSLVEKIEGSGNDLAKEVYDRFSHALIDAEQQIVDLLDKTPFLPEEYGFVKRPGSGTPEADAVYTANDGKYVLTKSRKETNIYYLHNGEYPARLFLPSAQEAEVYFRVAGISFPEPMSEHKVSFSEAELAEAEKEAAEKQTALEQREALGGDNIFARKLKEMSAAESTEFDEPTKNTPSTDPEPENKKAMEEKKITAYDLLRNTTVTGLDT